MKRDFTEKEEKLFSIMKQYTSRDVCIAFSGGTDSSLLLKLAVECAKEDIKIYAVTFDTVLHPSCDLEIAKKVAKEMGAIHKVIFINELEDSGIRHNPVDRCYRCKKLLFEKLMDFAGEICAAEVLEGTNEDDLHVYRPGIKAVRELGILSPLAEAGLTKKEVRSLAKEYRISVSGRASSPCLATRFPYGTRLSYEDMRRVEKGEIHLKKLGLYNVRLRVYKETVRIEVDSDALLTVLHFREEITAYLKMLGYTYVTLDLEGFRSGSMDEVLIPPQTEASGLRCL